MPRSCFVLSIAALLLDGAVSPAAERLRIEPSLLHLRIAEPREWAEFPERPAGTVWKWTLPKPAFDSDSTLKVRQIDVKQVWRVSLNGQRLGDLQRDENDMWTYLAVPKGTWRDSNNELRIEPASKLPKDADDVRVGEISLLATPLATLLKECRINVTVRERDHSNLTPCRITVLDEHGVMQVLGATSTDELAVRTGTVYSATGRATFGLPAGRYTVVAGRGCEYSIAQHTLDLSVGSDEAIELQIVREVDTSSYVACDTHVHTLTHSGHGDATETERLITLAGEGIELPIATDHNKHIDLTPKAKLLGVDRYLTPVIGNEVTTAVGHFNIFPINSGAPVVDHKKTDWGRLFDSIYQTPGVRIAILNHARDLHSGVRPFGPALHNAVVGENAEGWPLRFNAMEVVNSGATQSDPLRLFHDWMSLLNRGLSVTPVGSSDSHDVARHFVGQGRTYIRVDDREPGHIDVAAAVRRFEQGQVLVSYGLLAELSVHGVSSGEVARADGSSVRVQAIVRGPHWMSANRAMLFANGSLIREVEIKPQSSDTAAPGVKWRGEWMLPKLKHDTHLVLIATGPGVDGSYWKTAKPYQPLSIHWQPLVIGCSGAVWLDADGDGKAQSARDYAQRIVMSSAKDPLRVLSELANYDSAVAAQAAFLFEASGGVWKGEAIDAALKSAPEPVQFGFQSYREAVRAQQVARQKRASSSSP